MGRMGLMGLICELRWVTTSRGNPHLYRIARGFALLLTVSTLASCRESTPLSAIRSSKRGVAFARESHAGPSILSDCEFIDLTHAFDENTIYWPTAGGFKLTVDSFGVSEKGYFYAANSFAAAEHGGTHIDAPIHFHRQRATVDQIPLAQLIGDAVVIDVSEQCERNRDYGVTVGDFRAWEEKHSRQLVDVILLVRTGFGAFWPDRKRYMGTDQRGAEAVAQLHFPGIDPAAARWLVEHRSIKAIGIDSPSIDCGQSTLFESHVLLFRHNVPVLENVANLDLLPELGFRVIALPMKIRGGSGGPTRIVALVQR